MTFDTVKELFDTLPFEKQMEAVDFIQFLHSEFSVSKIPVSGKKYPFDIFSESSNYIAEDFDDMLDDFKDYA